MANSFQLNENDGITTKNRSGQKRKGLVGMFMNMGLAKTESQANIYLVIIAVLCIGVLIYQNIDFGGGAAESTVESGL